MAAAVAPRRSLEVESQRSPSVATQNASAPKTLKRMFQSTLRATGLSRERARDEQTSPAPATERRKDKEKEKHRLQDETKRALKATFTRKPKLSLLSGGSNDVHDRPFMGSLRHASMSSPVLPLFSNPIQSNFSSSAASGSTAAANVSPVRPRAYSRRSSTSRDKEREPNTPLQISRPRALQPASPSSPTFSQHHPNKGARGVSPSPQRNQSPPPRITRFPSISTSNLPSSGVQRTVSPTFQSRNTSTTSLNTSSPYREAIRTASSLLIKHLSRPPPPLRPHEWHDVEVRLRALTRLERIWGKSGGGGSSTTAVGSGSTLGGGEEREKRLFCETVRDGYVLCALLNKFRPGTVARPDPKEDGFAKTSNVTKFLAGALHYGISNADLFMRNDLLEASSESLGRVAQTIIALVRLGEPAQEGSRGIYMSVRDGTMSSPNLLDSGYRSPSARPGHRKRYSPPSALTPVPGSSSGKPSTPTPAPNVPRQTRATSLSGRTPEFVQETYNSPSFTPSLPPRSPLRSTVSPRGSIASGLTDSTTGFSLLDNRASARFATMRSGTTEATSIHPSETSSIMGMRQDSKTSAVDSGDQSQTGHQTQFTELPTTNRRRSYDREASAARIAAAAQSASLDASPTRLRRERRSSDLLSPLSPDLTNVEEVDEMGTRRGRPFAADLEADWSLLTPTSAPAVSPRRPSFDRPRVSFEDPADSAIFAPGVDLSTSPPKAKAGLPMRRPAHGHRHSVDTVSTTPTPMLLPVPRHSSLSRERDGQPSPSSSRESSTPSPPTGASRPSLVPRKSTSRASPRASYVPKLSNVDDPRRKHSGETTQIETTPSAPTPPRVPFPRSTSGDFTIAGTAGLSRLAPLPASPEATVPEEARTADSANGSSRNISPQPNAVRPVLARGRYNSELDTTGTRARKQRPNSLDDGGVRPGRSRFESMINLGTSGDVLARDSSLSVNAIRQPLIVREEGKPPMHYQIGNGIGRGQFGAVYRALNLNTGQMVAVKRIGLQDLSEDEISNLMKEVDVLKRLSHPSIVKYEGMVRSTDTLSIVLEYVENGSLGQTLKAFGKLNERLVASYVTKILEGLHYLHTSHVVHCDLKAANILTTKNGNVKLSDFGVSLNLHAKALEEIRNDVAGTPNWMAPEVIELKGPSTASDIWSLGCTTIELLTGHPPYHEIHNGLSVMFRIVEDASPPIPEACSPLMVDFLKQCFKKNPKERPSAEMLFEHPWLKTAWGEHKELRPQDSIPFLRRVSTELARTDARTLSVDTRVISLADSPRNTTEIANRDNVTNSQPAPLTPLSPNSPDGIVRNHSFIKTTFGRAVLCRVCLQSVKRSAVLCEECGLIAHARCAADAPASCDIRAQLLLYSQYSQASLAQEVSTPTQESASPAGSAPMLIPSSPSMSPRKRRQSDATFSSSPKLSERLLNWGKRSNKSPEPVSPPLPAVPGPSSYAYHPPRDDTPTPTPGPSTARSPILLASSPKAEKMRKPSRLSFQSTAKTDSMRSMVTAAETVSSSTPSYDSTPRSSVAQAGRRQPLPMSPAASTSTHAGTTERTTSEAHRLNTRSSVVSANTSEFGAVDERRRIKRLQQRDSVTSSKDSQCIIQ